MIKGLCSVVGAVALGGCATLQNVAGDIGLAPPSVVLSDYAQNCRIIKLSRKDTPDTQRAVLDENNKCRDAVRAEAPTR